MDHSQLAAELGHEVPETGTKSFDHEEYKAEKQQADTEKRKESRKGANFKKIGLVATEMTVDEEEELYTEFLKKEHTKCIATLNEAGNETTVISYDWEGKVRIFPFSFQHFILNVAMIGNHGRNRPLFRRTPFQTRENGSSFPHSHISNINKEQNEYQKKKCAALNKEKEEIATAATELIYECDRINALEDPNSDAAGFRRRSILAEMFAFQVGLRSRRWFTKKEALEEDIRNPKVRKERPEGKGGPKLGKYDVLKGKGKRGKKDGKTDRFGKFDASRVGKKGEKGRKKKERKPRKEGQGKGQAKEGGELVRNPNGPADGGDVMQY